MKASEPVRRALYRMALARLDESLRLLYEAEDMIYQADTDSDLEIEIIQPCIDNVNRARDPVIALLQELETIPIRH